MVYIFCARSQALRLCFHAHTEPNALALPLNFGGMGEWQLLCNCTQAHESSHKIPNAALLPASTNMISPCTHVIQSLTCKTEPYSRKFLTLESLFKQQQQKKNTAAKRNEWYPCHPETADFLTPFNGKSNSWLHYASASHFKRSFTESYQCRSCNTTRK